jgi:hypothetical protein
MLTSMPRPPKLSSSFIVLVVLLFKETHISLRRDLTPGKDGPVPIAQEAGWALQPV